MTVRLVQLRDDHGRRSVALAAGDGAVTVEGYDTTLALAAAAIAVGRSLADAARDAATGARIALDRALAERRVLPPIDHPDPAHLLLSGTGLTHLGSAEGRNRMHRDAGQATTDSMRMFLMGVEGGKPHPGDIGAQPEWFYKGDGDAIVAPEAALVSPAFAHDGGEEPEIAGIYLIGPDGTPWRLGFALANEFSDHVTERGNYLWLAHSKLRQAALGPELLCGALPDHVEGISRIRRDGAVLWERPFLSGEANMAHSIANLEAHHFKYAQFRRPGDVHVHFFGTATLSFADEVRTRAGDIFEIAAAPFALPLRNPLSIAEPDAAIVRPL